MPVEVKGALTARKALRQINPNLAKESQREVSALLRTITAKAKGYLPSETPMSGWVNNDGQGRWAKRGFDRGLMLRGITSSTAPTRPNKRGFRSLATIFNKGTAGAIYETAGRLSGLEGNFTPKLGGQLKGTRKMEGRLIFRAFDEDNGKVQAKVVKAIKTTTAKAATAMRGSK